MGVSLVSIDTVKMVLIDLTELPEKGREQIVIRCKEEHRALIDFAAQTLGLNQADFLRVVLINTAKKVISENARNAR